LLVLRIGAKATRFIDEEEEVSARWLTVLRQKTIVRSPNDPEEGGELMNCLSGS
jgi:hypothetical protein